MRVLLPTLLLCFACEDAARDAQVIDAPRFGDEDASAPSGRPDVGAGGLDASMGEPDAALALDLAFDEDAAPEADAAVEVDAEPQNDSAPAPDMAVEPDVAPEPDMAPAPVCGDGETEGDEACDDGNALDGDYCSADCAEVTGRCGDDVLQDNETCDDGDAHDGDYCRADCGEVTGRCGDGVLQNNERCDDGALEDGCDATHDGGDGTCVPIGQCVEGYLLVGEDCEPAEQTVGVDIFVANDCTMRVVPERVQVARGRTAMLTFNNRSRDYPVDVWMSYGGGFLDLPIGQSWDDPIPHCTGPRRPREESADISTACSRYVLPIECQ